MNNIFLNKHFKKDPKTGQVYLSGMKDFLIKQTEQYPNYNDLYREQLIQYLKTAPVSIKKYFSELCQN